LVELSDEPFDVPDVKEDVPTRGARIVYGSTASTGQFPYFTLIYVNRPTTTVQCGGTLIDPCWFVTAGHCVNK